ncbi:mechanosensitive ion channel family protein [Croceicoccus naphthovorans]|uniref:Small-conductance mechanosensitive channel n=1 Tax=Croceicoccus naphthovorans TaxID=1348774 RepID=A0A0G3XDU1_9SPHN|nr:mechanosensitive ion channel family protein [Croceicoccus naphthovorans]AKM08774.1 MscS mechanosensitive ion channel [Croceicoccus naphthovorans]MBB3992105.1 small-conductance mechanosensitive channel [Croceicoccus naphthovorans]
MLRLTRLPRILFPILFACLFPAGGAMAAVPLTTAPESTEPTEDPATGAAIETDRDAGADKRIANRIRAIFAAIEGLRTVEVDVREGVVSLSGSVASASAADQAETIASRVAGVVTVNNSIERDLDVGSNLAPTVNTITGEATRLWRSLPLLAVALAIAAVAIILARLLAGASGLWQRLTPNPFIAELVASALRFIGVLLGLYLMLKILGATALLGALLGIGGVIGIAIGFAVRDTIDNYISSVMLSLRQPFRANDHIVIEGNEGRVIRLTSRATVLMTLDGNHLRIPNATVFKSVILNYTRNPQRRFAFELGVDADDDPVEGMAVGLAAMAALDFVLNDPEPAARIEQVGDSNIVLQFLGWIDQSETDFYKARSLAIQAAKTALEAKGFALPEPIYRLRIDPRSAPMPTALPASTPPAAALQRPKASDPATPDTRPERHIADLVDQERRQSGERDLLDSNRPIE